jgi:hypothetical protein
MYDSTMKRTWAWIILLGCGSNPGGPDGGVTGDSGSASDGPAQLCVDTINMYRATLGLPPYARWSEGERCADSQAASDALTGNAHGAFGKCGEMAQNECPDWPGPPETIIKNCLAQMWAEGPGTDFATHGHYINMASKSYGKVACGVAQTSTGKYWLVQDFR